MSLVDQLCNLISPVPSKSSPPSPCPNKADIVPEQESDEGRVNSEGQYLPSGTPAYPEVTLLAIPLQNVPGGHTEMMKVVGGDEEEK